MVAVLVGILIRGTVYLFTELYTSLKYVKVELVLNVFQIKHMTLDNDNLEMVEKLSFSDPYKFCSNLSVVTW